jgi:hypothetical protein
MTEYYTEIVLILNIAVLVWVAVFAVWVLAKQNHIENQYKKIIKMLWFMDDAVAKKARKR